MIKIKKDGVDLTAAESFNLADVKVTITHMAANNGNGCAVSTADAGGINGTTKVQHLGGKFQVVGFVVGDALGKCGTLLKGQEVKVEIEITNPAHPFFGDKGEILIVFDGKTMNIDPGIDLTSPAGATISISPGSLKFCEGTPKGSTTTLTATVSDGSTDGVTWAGTNTVGGGAMVGIAVSGLTADFSGVAAGVYTVIASKTGVDDSAPVTVTINKKPTVSINTVAAGCVGTALSLTADGKDADGIAITTGYKWTIGATANAEKSATLTTTYPATATTYKVKVTDANGCVSDEATKSVTGDALPTVTLASTPASGCVGTAFTLTASPAGGSGNGYTYAWSDEGSGTNPTVTGNFVAAPGEKYTVKVTDGKGCISVAKSKTMTGNALPTVTLDIKPANGCIGTVLTVIAKPVGGSGSGYTYIWSDAGAGVGVADSQIATEFKATTQKYTVKVKDGNGCESSLVEKTVDAGYSKPTVTSITADGAAGCFGEAFTLTAVGASGGTGAYTYLWTGTGVTASTNVDNTGATFPAGKETYKLKVKDAKGCTSDEVSKEVTGHQVVLSGVTANHSITSGTSTKLEATVTLKPSTNTAIYNWIPVASIASGATGTTSAGGGAISATTTNLTDRTEFTLTVTDKSGFSCKDTDKVIVSMTGGGISVDIDESDGLKFCEGTTSGTETKLNATLVNASAGTIVEWVPTVTGMTTSGNTADFSGVAAGTYSVKAKVGTKESSAVTVIIYAKPTVTSITADKDAGCFGEAFTLTANGVTAGTPAYTYLWTGTGVTPSTTMPTTGATFPAGKETYKLKVKDAKGCTSDEVSKEVTGHQVVLSGVTANHSITSGTSTKLEATVTLKPSTNTAIYNWIPVASIASGATGTTSAGGGAISATTTNLTDRTEFTLTVTDKSGFSCKDTDKVIVSMTGGGISVDIDESDGLKFCEGATSGATTTLTATVVNPPAGGATIEWVSNPTATGMTTSGNTADFSGVAAGTYLVKAKVGAIESTEVTVIISPTPTISDITVTGKTGTNGNANVGDELTLSTTILPGGTTSLWTETPGTTLKAYTGNSVTTSGIQATNTYTVTATAGNCSASKSVTVLVDETVKNPILKLSLVRECAESGRDMVLTMTASGASKYSFTLKNTKGVVTTYTDETGPSWTKIITIDDESLYEVIGFKGDGINGEVQPPSITATFFPTPTIIFGEGTVRSICEGNELTLSATGSVGTVYTWDNGGMNGQIIKPSESGEYIVRARSLDGCIAKDTVQVTVNPKPTVAADATVKDICLGEKVILMAGGSATVFEWNNGQTGSPIEVTPNVGGTVRYVVTGTETVNGCSDTASVTVQINEPPVIVSTTSLERTIAIDKDVTFSVESVYEDKIYWERWDGARWMALYDATSGTPAISGSMTASLTLTTVPRSWDGSRFRCVVENACGDDDTVFLLNVKECFEILDVEWELCEGIRPELDPTIAIDGWYCPGTKIAVCASIILEDLDIEVENPVYKWTIDGLSIDDARWDELDFISEGSVLSWIPPADWQDNITIALCAYADGACDTICKKYLRLKASPFTEVEWDLVTSLDPERMFCPGDTVKYWVDEENNSDNLNHTYKWYNDIFALPEETSPNNDVVSLENKELVLAMGQKNTWVKVLMTPSTEVCTRQNIYSKEIFLEVKDLVEPEFSIWTEDTLACLYDKIYLEARWENAGENPKFQWTRSVGLPEWDLGTEWTATAVLDEDDMWIKCELIPSDEVCYNTDSVFVDAVQIKAIKDARVFIFADLQGKTQEDEIVIESDISGMPIVDPIYTWYINNRIHPEEDDEEFISDELRHRDSIQLGVNGERICQNKVMSNVLYIDYGKTSRDTLLTIFNGETVKNLSMVKPEDDLGEVMFVIEDRAEYGMSSISTDGMFSYIPNTSFIGTDEVTYQIINKLDKRTIAEGTIYITVTDNDRFVVPNLITPNEDGLNDTWKLEFLANYPDHRIMVFNTNGNVVFEATNYQNDWDGTGSPTSGYVGNINLINGVYAYVIELGGKNKTVLRSWIEIRSNLNRRNYR